MADDTRVFDEEGLDQLIAALQAEGYAVHGPVVRNAIVTIAPIADRSDLPRGWHDSQAPGRYRLELTDDPRFFAFAVGPESARRAVEPSEELLWSATRETDGEISVQVGSPAPERIALLGLRACDVVASEILHRVRSVGEYPDQRSVARKNALFVVAVECASSAPTCFCASMGTGPALGASGYDIALNELADERGHRFLVRAGSDAGQQLLDRLDHDAAEPADLALAAASVAAAGEQQRHIRTDGLPERLEATMEHPRWDDVASRCLSCGNCTLVCPTCFCHSIEERSSLDGSSTGRWRSWDSCFSLDHSYVNGGSVRSSTRSRYRQWLTHKLGTWHEQFGTSGCVGCGRCITWCPPGIDITEEAAALWQDPG